MNKDRVKWLISFSWDSMENLYRQGAVSALEWKVFRHLWPRITYRMIMADRGFYGKGVINYQGLVRKFNKIRAFWGLEATK